MSFNAISGPSGTSLTPPGETSAVTQTDGATPTSATPQATGTPQPSSDQPPPPFLLVPTDPPLTPKVLAELIGRQLPLN